MATHPQHWVGKFAVGRMQGLAPSSWGSNRHTQMQGLLSLSPEKQPGLSP